MKRAAILGLSLFIVGAVLQAGGANSGQSDKSFQSFWASFKQAVINGNSESVSRLSKFPIGMSSPANNILSRSELRERFNELFINQVDAAQCFAHTKPSQDTENREIFTVACRYAGGSDAAAYQFEHTKVGWKFTHFQLSTTCRCR